MARLLPAAEAQAGQRDQRRRGFTAVPLAIQPGRHRIVIKIERPCLDQIEQRLSGQLAGLDGRQQGEGNRVGLRRAMGGAVQQIAPPLEADFAGKRLVDQRADAGDIGAERIKREEMGLG